MNTVAAPQADELDPPRNRMAIALLALVGLLISTYMSLYKLGVFGVIACGTGDCERVQNSPWAVFLGIPVPYLGFVGYGALMVTAMLGMQPRFARDRRISLVLLAGALVGFGFSIYLSYLEAAVIGAWCRYCIASAIIATLLFLFTIPELFRLRADA